jgi:hypothetical protein
MPKLNEKPNRPRPLTRLEAVERWISLTCLAVAALPLLLILLLVGVGVRLMEAVVAVLRAVEKVAVVDRLMAGVVKEEEVTAAAREAAITEVADRLKVAAMETDHLTTAMPGATETGKGHDKGD